ncbi:MULTISPECIES: diguanylate cyclase [unclassified Janthinobacterium]|uniref:diguanylate cyclase n=1 Tax=unclassified Janthinobacterium TaxID=2610881 RepID=UPI001A316DA1|nr:diguanylate cyclase [Janthinobacterium sp. CG_23.4]MDH6160242.1 diguanylate cyclase (GGDEF)-like protein [Janthinobacterium sp. CG_23.4]
MSIDSEPEGSGNAREGSRPLLLIVDDQPSNIQVLFDIFKDDCEVCMALSGEAAFAFIEQRQPDLILLDIVMPDIGGFAVCKRIKESARTADIPVIFVTANNDPEEEARGLVAGAVDFIIKPFHATVVKARVKTQLTVKRQADQLRSMAMVDGLTGVANRRRYDAVLEIEWRRAARERKELAVIMIDVDFFKRYNDRFGHLAGDNCLQQVAKALQQRIIRSSDLLARYGGEEFACVLPATGLDGALIFSKMLEQWVRALALPHPDSEAAPVVTVSIGVAVGRPSEGGSAAALLAAADAQLYCAKQSGRARVCGQQFSEQRPHGDADDAGQTGPV